MEFYCDRDFEKGEFYSMPKLAYKSKLTPTAIAILGYLYYCRNGENKCFPSRQNIADRCGIRSVSTVDKYLKELEDNFLLYKSPRYNSLTRHQTSNLYELPYIEPEEKKKRRR